jgi:hypothetical protein
MQLPAPPASPADFWILCMDCLNQTLGELGLDVPEEMIQLMQSPRIGSVSDLAVALGRELSNVSRTLSRMAAYGLVGFEENAGDARAKKPVWKLSVLPDHEGLDWIQAYCLAMALQKRTGIGMDSMHFSTMESAVRDAVAFTVEQIDLTK